MSLEVLQEVGNRREGCYDLETWLVGWLGSLLTFVGCLSGSVIGFSLCYEIFCVDSPLSCDVGIKIVGLILRYFA